MTWSFSSGVWSRGTTTSAQDMFCSSFTFFRKKNTNIKDSDIIRKYLKAKPDFCFLPVCDSTRLRFLLTVLPPFPMTLPAAKEGTLMWASSFTSSLGPKKFSSFSLPKMRHWACSKTWRRPDYSGCIRGTSCLFLPRREANWPVKQASQVLFSIFPTVWRNFTLNWASGGPAMMTILCLGSIPSAGAICPQVHTIDVKHKSLYLLTTGESTSYSVNVTQNWGLVLTQVGVLQTEFGLLSTCKQILLVSKNRAFGKILPKWRFSLKKTTKKQNSALMFARVQENSFFRLVSCLSWRNSR